MKLIFNKDDSNNINVKLQKGTIVEDFSYVEMTKQLLANDEFEDPDYTNLSSDERDRLSAMLKKISEVFISDEPEGNVEQK